MAPVGTHSEVEAMGRLGLLDAVERAGQFGIVTQDLQCGGIVWSHGLLALLGVHDASVLRGIEDIGQLVHPLDRTTFRDMLVSVAFSGLFAVQGEFRILRPDGLKRWIRIAFELKHDPAGEPLTLVHLVFDTSAARLAEERAGDAISHRRELAHGINNISWTIPAGKAKPEVPLWTELTGQLLHETAGDGWLNAIHPEDRAGTERAWRLATAQQTPYVAGYRLRLRSGDYRWFVARGAPVFGLDGQLERWIGACMDVHELGTRILASSASEDLRISGDHLRAARGLLNWSVRELASRAGITPAIIRRMEEERLIEPSDRAWPQVKTVVEAGGAAFIGLPDGAVAVVKKRRAGSAGH